jgi:sulfur carrier protein
MITLSVNNEKKQLESTLTVEQLLQQCGFEKDKIAVAVNTEFVCRADYHSHVLSDNDKVDILAPVQGG